ncbi:MAG: hypothetical protein A3G32_07380 [Deltaproteobacteria bacterium RIFCSPLOWO2_12_FULL_40_28]|nr:MAG: hypothetical protein A3C45_07425 [Deltaproteobacteria bacterium RIFCSPHIGHO2_02_FULL_40_28]OGQ19223.1 MAG: hypothetical protein A3E27_04390 [Deltaproteobacteria bacterium RIFCSPHIGHO2_12_FULL_40_32]OGQ40553.1 MAG: hypothetical protein A3I69_00680 [Deltaproteobacteria bacterium RIFCSPLOWO2_02_FULL_40_36]OGQ53788.1 MAG: hypothetical protein A3G32_07380 [Deltaproteobacteria bacterium RIFCSPLOWO2_12_FULL_40_28]
MKLLGNKAFTSPWRFVKAYHITFVILAKYFFLWGIQKIISEKRAITLTAHTHQKSAKKIVESILELKGLYIKIGQTLSIMTNFLPKAFTEELEQLQDAVPPHPYEDVVARFEEDFGEKPDEIFSHFEKIPLASASLGQVHRATLKDGTKLAIKLQYPQIDEIVESDLKTLKKIFSILDFIFPNYGIKSAFGEGARMIVSELDYNQEGQNIEKISKNLQENPNLLFPKVYWEYSSKKILSLEFMEGVKVTNLNALKDLKINPQDVAKELIHAYCKQIFIDGIYHADPHPGNILVSASCEKTSEGYLKPIITLVDYGATAEISPQMRAGITLFVEGLIKKDTRVISGAMKQMGFIAKIDNEETFDKIVDYFYSKIRGVKIDDFRKINISNFQHLDDIIELRKMDISFRELTTTFHVPKDWILLERTLILMMGLTTHLDPHLNPMDIVTPYVEEFVLGKDKKVTDIIIQASKELLLSYIGLPTEIRKLIKKLDEGKLTITVKDQKNTHSKIADALQQLTLGLMLITSVSFAYLFHQNGNAEFYLKTKYLSYFFGFSLFVSLIRNRKH